MSFGPNATGLILGVVVLVGCVLLLPGRRLAAVRSLVVGAAGGALAYPLLLCLFMGCAGAMARPDGHHWIRFRLAFSTYAQSALEESVPRGAVLGAFVVACWAFWRRARARRPGVAGPSGVAQDA